jgi:SAM-dependent methyltransferase
MSSKTSEDLIVDLMTDEEFEKMDEMMNNIKDEVEFEVIMNNTKNINNPINFDTFVKLLKYLKFISKKEKKELKSEYSMDINYSHSKTDATYRLTITGIDSINKIMRRDNEWQSHLIYQKVLSRYLQKDKNIELMKKTRIDIMDLESIGSRARLSREEMVTKAESDMLQRLRNDRDNTILFRTKERASLIVFESKTHKIRVDLTLTKQSQNINKVNDGGSNYELEIELIGKTSPDGATRLKLYDIITNLMRVIQGSKYIINKSTVDNIILAYKTMIKDTSDRALISLDGRNPVSLEIQHVVDSVANKYAVTDKADGERYFLIIVYRNVYLFSNNMRIRKTGIILNDKQAKYNDTILDGEYVFLPKENRSTFMAFDCLSFKGEDVRKTEDFMKRLSYVDEVVENCFVFGKQSNYVLKPYQSKSYNSDALIEYYDKEIDKYLDILTQDIEKEKHFPLIRRKFFIPVLGINDNEIFKYSTLLWNKYVVDPESKCPYILDGLIYHPLHQEYTTNSRDSKLPEYKWKPEDKNSIDFYIKFLRDRQSDEIMTLFDDSDDEMIKGKPYRIAYLHVGKKSGDEEYPVLFKEDARRHISYIFLTDGEPRDLEGNIIQDETVVEFYYNNNSTVNEYHRWVPMRTRHDKTQMVKKFKKRYGNYSDTANKIWRSIINPVSIRDINILSDDNTYLKQLNILRSRVSHDIILAERREDVYYKFRTNLGKPMRNFHNFIKSIIIYLYCNMTYNRNKKLTILDMACGAGGDIMKFYYSRTGDYVGIDIDNFGLINPTDGALSRYNKLKNRPNFPKMTFIHADVTALLDPEEQEKALSGTTQENLKLMKNIFSLNPKERMTFDCINCQFALHYFLENELKWNNFIKNINMYLKPGGFALFTCFDAGTIVKEMEGKDSLVSSYTDGNGTSKVYLEIKKRYKDLPVGEVYGLGNGIDVHNALIQREGEYVTEYLVDKEFLIDEFDKKCNMEVMETDTFESLFHTFRDYFMFASKYENIPETAKFLENAFEFYDQKNEINKAAFKMTRLNRYYIFRKRTRESEKSKSSQKGGTKTNVKDIINDKSKFETINIKDSTHTFVDSFLTVCKIDEIIPQNITYNEFRKQLKLGTLTDKVMNEDNIIKFIKNIEIENEDDISKKIVLNKPNIIIIDDDCSIGVEGYTASKNIHDTKQNILMIRKDGKYQPVIKKDDLGYIGILNSNSNEPILNELIERIE